MLGINMQDVKNVLVTCTPYLVALGVVIGLAIIITIACFKLEKRKRKLVRSQTWITTLVAVVLIINLVCLNPLNTLITLATGKGSVTEETSKEANDLCKEIADEGIVLLKNDDDALPLSNTKLNVFGWASTNPLYGGTGSGALNDAYPITSLLDGLKEAGFEINEQLTDFYKNYQENRPIMTINAKDWTVPEPELEEYDEANVFETAKDFSDTAVIVISRCGGEGGDLPSVYGGEEQFMENGERSFGIRYSSYEDDKDVEKSYLELTNREMALVERVTEEFSEVVVIVNSANVMELGWLDDYDSIKGALLTPGPGQTGFLALGEILNGSVNPSGKTVDTFAADLRKNPTINNFGGMNYDNMNEMGGEWYTIPYAPSFVNYVEGIYVGYKFYETAAEEGLIDYENEVVYPFGYGLSYTTFDQKMGEITDNEGVISFDVTVTNTGEVAGKDVVEVYYNPPYTNGGIEKASVNLIAFDKTNLLQPGESQTVNITFNAEDMASYDTYGEGAYVLEEGKYEISIRTDSHTVIDTKDYQVEESIVYNGDNKRSTDLETAENRFEFCQGDVTYLSRKNGFENYEEASAAPASYSMSEEYKSTYINDRTYNPEEFNNEDDQMPVTGAKNGLKLVDMRGLDYEDEKWNVLLDQLTVSDMDSLIALAGFQTAAVESVGKIRTVDCDGPASINNNFTGKGSIGFPSAVMIASTWNEEIAKAFGASIGKMADEMEVSGWYAPAMNIHRSPFAGRNFEYYSEDGLLSGKMAANAVMGAKEYGVYAYIKHFALNDQETNRDKMVCTWANEQSIREIYLKPFELAVKEGGAQAVMSSYNYIGNRWAGGCGELLNQVLRGEWGFRGFVLSDWWETNGYMDADMAVRNGTDACLVNYDGETNHVTEQTSATAVNAMRQASKNIMYTVVNSRAYEEDNLDTGLLGWQIIMIIIDIIIAIGAIVLEVLTIRKFKQHISIKIEVE